MLILALQSHTLVTTFTGFRHKWKSFGITTLLYPRDDCAISKFGAWFQQCTVYLYENKYRAISNCRRTTIRYAWLHIEKRVRPRRNRRAS